MNIIVIGPQGSGKGTQAKLLVKKLGLAYFEAGDVLREKTRQNSSLARLIDRIINRKGTLVPDEMMEKIVEEWLDQARIEKGIIFDGYPRNLNQYQFLKRLLAQKGAKVDQVFSLQVSRAASLNRLAARRICPRCDQEYNLATKPPKNDELCDQCQVRLARRRDDLPAKIKVRLKTFWELTRPVIDAAGREGVLEKVNGERSIEAIHRDIIKRLKS